MEAKKKKEKREYTCRKEITIFRTEIRKRKGSKKKFKNFNKNFTSSVQGKKKILECLSKGVGTQDS